jgi:Helicase associated domain
VPQPYTTEEGYRLGAWVNSQRSRYRQGKLTDKQIEQLGRFPEWTWSASDSKWDNAFRHLVEYADTHGTARVPNRHIADGVKLGDWVVNQRVKWNKLSEERKQRLKSLPGWVENTNDAQWEQGFEQLLAYMNEHGTAAVPRGHVAADGYRLGSWVDSRRNEYKRSKLTPERVSRLGDLPGWHWGPRASKWNDAFQRLHEYLERNGGEFPTQDCIDRDGLRLGAWVFMQRNLYRKGELDAERAKRLDEIPGWEWNPREERWGEGFGRLAVYLKRNRYAVPIAKYVEPDGYRLGAWVSQQRSLGNQGKLPSERRARLDALKGWTWNAPRGGASHSR